MSNETSLPERVYLAVRNIQAEHMPIDRFTVKVHPAMQARAVQEMPQFSIHRPPSGEWTVFGLPIATDPTLAEDRIVLVYEVEA